MSLPLNVNLAQKFSPKLDQAFKRASYTDAFVNQDYDFDGVNSIKVWTLDTTPLVNYDMSNNQNRYGGFSEITDTVNTYILSIDKAFQKSLDTGNEQDSLTAKKAAQWLALQMNTVLVPAVDKNRFATAVAASLAAGGGGQRPYVAANVLKDLQIMNANLDEMNVPMEGRVACVTPFVVNDLKGVLTPIMNDPQDGTIHSRGLVGEIDGLKIVSVPSYLLPEKVKVAFWHKSALLSARKLNETKILDGGALVSGKIIQGRFRYDSWALKGHDSSSGVDTKLATFQSLIGA